MGVVPTNTKGQGTGHQSIGVIVHVMSPLKHLSMERYYLPPGLLGNGDEGNHISANND